MDLLLVKAVINSVNYKECFATLGTWINDVIVWTYGSIAT